MERERKSHVKNIIQGEQPLRDDVWPGGAHRALCPRCAKSRLFSASSSHGSQGPELCTPDAVLNGSCPLL